MSASASAPAGGEDSMMVATAPRVEPTEEATAVRGFLMKALPMVDGDEFFVISFRWWQAWAAYTQFDVAAPEAATLSERPGPIITTDLAAPTTPPELKPGLTEDYDYKLLPRAAYDKLAAWYGAEVPAFSRVALNRAAPGQSPDVVVELFPVRSRVGIIASDGRPTAEAATLLLSRRLPLTEIKHDVLAAAKRLVGARPGNQEASSRTRIWFKRVFEEPLDAANDDRDVNSDGYVVVEDAAAPASPLAERQSTETEEEAFSYSLFEETSSRSAMTLLDLVEAGPVKLALLVEFRDAYDAPWPRAQVLNAWKFRLAAGAEVDAQDSENVWYEGIVTKREDSKLGDPPKLGVHYMGWGSRWDALLDLSLPKDVAKLARRNEKVAFWRNLGVGDKVELKDTSGSKGPTWYSAEIEEVRDAGEAMPLHAKGGEAVEALPIEEEALPGKRLLAMATVSRREPMRRWVAAQGESICRLYTHLKEEKVAAKARTTPTYGSYSSYSSYTSYDSGTRGRPPLAGAVGLRNLGNTCFMNSMLQCIAHAPPLTSFFLNGDWRTDVNEDNPLGMGGKLATVYASFLKDVWGGTHSVVAPTQLKRTVGNFNPTFAGYAQQDSQEFMSFLLDGLHEDLNRRRSKPYTEQVESNGRPDAEVAAEQWRRHLLRNDSIVVDHCHGLLRSHLTCCDCGNNSITFDPYLSLSLPLPVSNTRRVSIVLLPADLRRRPTKMAAELPSRQCLGDVKTWIATESGIARECLILTDVWQHKVTKTYRDAHPLAEVREDHEIWAHELASPPLVAPPEEEEDDEEEDTDATTAEEAEGRAGASSPVPDEGAASPKEKKKSNWNLGIFGRKKPKHGDRATDGKAEPEGYPSDQYADLVLMVERKNSSYTTYGSRVEIFGPPRRIFVGADATNHDIYAKVREMNARFLRAEDPGAAPTSNGTAKPAAGPPGPGSPNRPASKATADPVNEHAEGDAEAPVFFRLVATPNNSYQSPNSHVLIPENEAVFQARASSKKLVGVIYTPEGSAAMDGDEVRTGLDEHASVAAADERNDRGAPTLSLQACFDRLTEREQLNETDMWYCSECKAHVRAYKKLDLWSVPDVLILHLKRFQYLPGTYFVHRQKLEDLVDFPLEGLDMANVVQGGGEAGAELRYDLFAVSEHSGGLGGGHYTAVARNMEGLEGAGSDWYAFNDSGVSPADHARVVTTRAYVLFYKRRGASVKWGGMHPTEAETEVATGQS